MKNWISPRRVEWISFITMMPVLCFVLNYLLFDDRVFSDYRIWVYSFPVIFAQGLISWYLHILSMHWLRIKFPEFRQTIFRLFLLAIIHLSLISFSMVVFFYGFDAVGFLGYKVDVEKFNLGIIIGGRNAGIRIELWSHPRYRTLRRRDA